MHQQGFATVQQRIEATQDLYQVLTPEQQAKANTLLSFHRGCVLIGLVVVLVRGLAGGFAGSGGAKSARQLLDERFARGEIDQKEYEERRRLLE